MLCQKCKKNNANVYYKQNVNGKVTEVALCSECAAASGIDIDPFASSGFNILGSLFGMKPASLGYGTRKVCPLCGSAISDIAETGKVGCAKCYDTFAAELAPTITRIHGRVRHVGRAPKEYKAKLDAKNKLDKLNEQLKDAIEKQEFEQAAKLRDEIKRLQA